jgi:hypothetical protein
VKSQLYAIRGKYTTARAGVEECCNHIDELTHRTTGKSKKALNAEIATWRSLLQTRRAECAFYDDAHAVWGDDPVVVPRDAASSSLTPRAGALGALLAASASSNDVAAASLAIAGQLGGADGDLDDDDAADDVEAASVLGLDARGSDEGDDETSSDLSGRDARPLALSRSHRAPAHAQSVAAREPAAALDDDAVPAFNDDDLSAPAAAPAAAVSRKRGRRAAVAPVADAAPAPAAAAASAALVRQLSSSHLPPPSAEKLKQAQPTVVIAEAARRRVELSAQLVQLQTESIEIERAKVETSNQFNQIFAAFVDKLAK